MSAAADSARVVAGNAMERLIARLHEVLPRRKPAYRRVTPLASRRETQRRAAIAVIALLVVVGSLAMSVWAFGGQRQQQAISSVNAGQDALDKAKANLALVSGPGIDLIEDDRDQAIQLLTEAYDQLDTAEDARISARVVDPVREDVTALLDRAYGVVLVASTPLFTFTPAEGAAPFDLRTLVRGYDSAPYVIDRATNAVYRVDLKRKRATNIARNGRSVGNLKMAAPQFLSVGGRDLLILDAKNVLWRWRASNDSGKGTTNRITVNGSTGWGDDILAIGTYLRDASRGLYNLYVIDPSEQQIRHYPPASDGGGFPAKSSAWLATARAVDKMTSLYIDGDMYITENGVLDRYHLREERRVGAREARRRAAAAEDERGPGRWGGRAELGPGVHLRPRERPAHRLRQAERRLRRPVPARRGRWLGGPPLHVRHRRGRGGAGHRGLAVERYRQPGSPRGRADHRRRLPRAVGLRRAERFADGRSQLVNPPRTM